MSDPQTVTVRFEEPEQRIRWLDAAENGESLARWLRRAGDFYADYVWAMRHRDVRRAWHEREVQRLYGKDEEDG